MNGFGMWFEAGISQGLFDVVVRSRNRDWMLGGFSVTG